MVGVAAQDSNIDSASSATPEGTTTAELPPVVSVANALMENCEIHETGADYPWKSDGVVEISLNGDAASVSGDGVSTNFSTLTITTPGTYSISGSLLEGQIIVDVEKSGEHQAQDEIVRLIFNGIHLENTTLAPIYIKQAENTLIILAENTKNEVIGGTKKEELSNLSNGQDGITAETDTQNAAIFSADDLTISGDGSLHVIGTGQDGITSKDGLVLIGGEITVGAIDDGIRGKDYLVIKDSTITVTSEGDGLKSDNTQDEDKGFIYIEDGDIRITSKGDSIHAQTDLLISGGSFNLMAGGGSSSYLDPALSSKGLKADNYVIMDFGRFKINSADDAVHSNGNMVINDGSFTIATADDGFHADSSLEINGGEIRITESYEGLESAVITINAGEIFISSEDDGINVVGGVDGSGLDTMPGRGQGGRIPPGGEFPQGGWENLEEIPPGDPRGQREGIPPGVDVPQDGWGDQGEIPQGDQRSQRGWPPQDNFLSTGNNHLTINGGRINIDAGGDGIDVNGSIEMKSGVVLIQGPTENMNGALDCIGTFNISGGTLVAVGSAGMAEAPDETSTQNSLLLNLNQPYPSGTVIHIQSSDGEEILSFETMKSFQSIAFSSNDLLEGQTYEVYLDDTPYITFIISGPITRIGQQMRR